MNLSKPVMRPDAEIEQMLGKEKRLQRWVAGHEKNLCVLIYFKKYNFYLKCDGKP